MGEDSDNYPRGRTLGALIAIVVVNGIVCIVAPAAIVLAPNGASSPVGHLVFVLAATALALTPLQLIAVWLVIAPFVRNRLRRARIAARIDYALEHGTIGTAFQPIVNLSTNQVFAAEALSRFDDNDQVTTSDWFAEAEEIGRGIEFELAAIRTALRRAADVPANILITVNASPATITSPEFFAALDEVGIPGKRIVVEITEWSTIADYPLMQRTRRDLAHAGIQLAVDDAGSGYASLRHIVALAPDIIKLDRSLIVDIDADEARRALVGAVVSFALQSGAVVLGEGVERSAEAETLARLGVEAAQGYLFGRPTTSIDEWKTWTAVRPTARGGLSDIPPIRPPSYHPPRL